MSHSYEKKKHESQRQPSNGIAKNTTINTMKQQQNQSLPINIDSEFVVLSEKDASKKIEEQILKSNIVDKDPT